MINDLSINNIIGIKTAGLDQVKNNLLFGSILICHPVRVFLPLPWPHRTVSKLLRALIWPLLLFDFLV